MEQLKKEIIATIIKIEAYCHYILIGKYQHAKSCAEALVEEFRVIFPQIIQSYDKYDYLNKEDKAIWLDQLRRILASFESDDDFVSIDVMGIETVDKLKDYLMCLEKADELQHNI